MGQPKPGDIVLLPLPGGHVVYGQYVYEDSEYGSLLRFQKMVYPDAVDHPGALFEQEGDDYFFAWTALQSLLAHGRLITPAEHAPLVGFSLPLFQVGFTRTTWPDRRAGERMSEAQVDALPRITAHMELSLIEAVAQAAGVAIPPEVGETWYEAESARRHGGRSVVPAASGGAHSQVILITVPHDQLTDEVRARVDDAVAIAGEAGANVDGEEFGPDGLTVFVYTDDVEATLQCLSGALNRSGSNAKNISLSVAPTG